VNIWTLDFWLPVALLAIVPLAMAAYGGHVAAEAYPDKYVRLRVRLTFWAIGLLGLIVAFAYQHRTMNEDAKSQEATREWQSDVSQKLDAITKLPTSPEKQQAVDQLKNRVMAGPRNIPEPHPVMDTAPSSYVQTFDAGLCDGQKPIADPERGLFTGLENAASECENGPGGRKQVVRFGQARWSGLHVAGLTPNTYTGKTMRVTIRWFMEWLNINFTDKHIEWDIYVSCGGAPALMGAQAWVNILNSPLILTDTTITVNSCRAGEKYQLTLARDGGRDGTPGIASVEEFQTDLR
jgi:hypothetical protein